MKVLYCNQRTDEWIKARLGRLCGSRAGDMLAKVKGGLPSTSRQNLKVQLVLERLSGRSHERQFQSKAMQDGVEREESAIGVYECLTGRLVQPVGYVQHDELMAGCSPDGQLNDFEGLVEAKCPIPATHLEFLKTGKIPKAYADQITHGLWITGAKYCDYLSFSDSFEERLQVKLVRVLRDEEQIAAYEHEVRCFLNEVELELMAVRTMADPMDAFRRSVEA